jgi:hypothetical protein
MKSERQNILILNLTDFYNLSGWEKIGDKGFSLFIGLLSENYIRNNNI